MTTPLDPNENDPRPDEQDGPDTEASSSLEDPTGAVEAGALPLPDAPEPTAPATDRNQLGVTAVIAGVTALVLSVIRVIVLASMTGDAMGSQQAYESYLTASMVFTIVEPVIGLIAVVLGLVGLLRRGRRRAAAGIGLGIGVAVLMNFATSVLYSGLLSAVTQQ